MQRRTVAVVGVVGLLSAITLGVLDASPLPGGAAPSPAGVARGRYLPSRRDCAECHTGAAGAPSLSGWTSVRWNPDRLTSQDRRTNNSYQHATRLAGRAPP